MADIEYETTRDVLRAMMVAHGEHEGPTAREALGLQIRMECARAGLPKPDLGHWPPSELASAYFEGLTTGVD